MDRAYCLGILAEKCEVYNDNFLVEDMLVVSFLTTKGRVRLSGLYFTACLLKFGLVLGYQVIIIIAFSIDHKLQGFTSVYPSLWSLVAGFWLQIHYEKIQTSLWIC